MGKVPGFWLTWYYFGYSPVYGNSIALVQIVAGLMIMVPRLSLAGALLLLPVAANIVLVDIFYGVDRSGLFAAVVLLALLIGIVAPHVPRLWQAVFPPVGGRAPGWIERLVPARAWAGVAWAARIALVVCVAKFTHHVAHNNNRSPTPIDGVWDPQVELVAGGVERVFFEYNRAFMAVLKDTTSVYAQRHFEVEPDGSLRIWERWLRKGELLYEGRYTDTEIRLWPAGQEETEGVTLRRAAP